MSRSKAKAFSIIFWNVWVENQLVAHKLHRLYGRFDEFIAKYRPDAFGLNEVLEAAHGMPPPLLTYLESRGYRVFFAPFGPERNGQRSGTAFASLLEPRSIKVHELGPDKHAELYGHQGHSIKLIRARMLHASQPVNIVVVHLSHLMPYNWMAHVKQHRTFRNLMRSPGLQTSTIIGGDFNRFKFLPSLQDDNPSRYSRATGSLMNPTWKLVGKFPLIQANYDNLLWTTCGKLLLQEFKLLKRHPSDHTPLYARFLVG